MVYPIFKRPDTATTVQAETPSIESSSIATTAKPVIDKAAAPSLKREYHHQYKLIPMLEGSRPEAEYLATQIPINFAGDSTHNLLCYYHDLCNLPIEKAIQTETFEKFKSLIKPSRINALVRLGTTPLASQEGGVKHAKRALDISLLLKGMQPGILAALQGRDLSETDKQEFLEEHVIQDLETQFEKGSYSPEEVLSQISKISTDKMYGAQATQGKQGKALKALEKKAKTQIEASKQAEEIQVQEKEMTTLLETFLENYKKPHEKQKKLADLLLKLESLQAQQDGTVKAGAKAYEALQSTTREIIALIKEINPKSELSEAHVKNPLSRNIQSGEASELNSRLEYEIDCVMLSLNEEINALNKELVQKCKVIQASRSVKQKIWDSVAGSQVTDILKQSAKTEKAIATLSKSVKAYEEAEKLKQVLARKAKLDAEIAKNRTWSDYLTGGAKITPKTRFEMADKDLCDFVLAEGTKAVFDQAALLETQVAKIEKTTYVSEFLGFGKKAKDLKAAREDLEIFRAAHQETFDKFQSLLTAKEEAEAAFKAASPKAAEVVTM